MAANPTPTPTAYTLEQAETEIAALRGQLAAVQEIISTVSDKAFLLYAPDAHATPRGPTLYQWSDGTVDGWSANSGAVTQASGLGWPDGSTTGLLLTANGGAQPYAGSTGPGNTGLNANAILTQPGDPIVVSSFIYCPAAQTNVWIAMSFYDDTGTFISSVYSPLASFSAGQIQTLYVNAIAPDLAFSFGVFFGCNNTLAAGQLIYAGTYNVQGNLSISASPGGGVDSVGNPYDAGYEVQLEKQGAFRVKGLSGQVATLAIANGIPFIALSTGASEEAQAANFQAFLNNKGASETMVCFLVGPKGNVHTNYASVLLESDAKDGSQVAEGALNWNSSGDHFWAIWNNKGLKVYSALETGSFNTYQPERITGDMINNVVINSNTFTQFLPGPVGAWSLGVGHYHLHAQIVITPTSTGGTATLEPAGGGGLVINYMGLTVTEVELKAPNAIGNGANLLNFGVGYTSALLNTTNPRVYTFDGNVAVSTAGNFAFFANTNGVGAYNILRTGTYMEMFPIGP